MGSDEKFLSVLWLDDQISYLSSVTAKISAGDFSISTARTAIEAVRKIQASQIDIALVDVQLHGKDFESWYHFIDSVRRLSPETRFLIVTNHTEIPRSPEVGMDDISIVKKSVFTEDPIQHLRVLASEERPSISKARSSVEDYKDTLPTDISWFHSVPPAWNIFNKLAKSTVLKLFSTLPILILLYATMAKIPEIFTGSGGIPAILPILAGYFFLLVSFVLIIWKCPPIVSENQDGIRYHENIYQSYLSDKCLTSAPMGPNSVI